MALEPTAAHWMPTGESALDGMVDSLTTGDEAAYVPAADLAASRAHMGLRPCAKDCDYPTALHDLFEQSFGTVETRNVYESGLPSGAAWTGVQSLQALSRVRGDYDNFRPGDRCWETEGAWYGIPTSATHPLDPKEGYGMCTYGKGSTGEAGVWGFAGDGAMSLPSNPVDAAAGKTVTVALGDFDRVGPVHDSLVTATSLVGPKYPYGGM